MARKVEVSLIKALNAAAEGQKTTKYYNTISAVNTELIIMYEEQQLMSEDTKNCYFNEKTKRWEPKWQIIAEENKRQYEINMKYGEELWKQEFEAGTLPFQTG